MSRRRPSGRRWCSTGAARQPSTNDDASKAASSRISNSTSSPSIHRCVIYKGRGSPYSIAERRVSELISVLGSQPAGDVNH